MEALNYLILELFTLISFVFTLINLGMFILNRSQKISLFVSLLFNMLLVGFCVTLFFMFTQANTTSINILKQYDYLEYKLTIDCNLDSSVELDKSKCEGWLNLHDSQLISSDFYIKTGCRDLNVF